VESPEPQRSVVGWGVLSHSSRGERQRNREREREGESCSLVLNEGKRNLESCRVAWWGARTTAVTFRQEGGIALREEKNLFEIEDSQDWRVLNESSDWASQIAGELQGGNSKQQQ
jgi:hypothetical protein